MSENIKDYVEQYPTYLEALDQLAKKEQEIKILKELKAKEMAGPIYNAVQTLATVLENKDIFEKMLNCQEIRVQLAIEELEKAKMKLRTKLYLLDSSEFAYPRHFVAWHDICEQINKQIKELRSEKDVKEK